MATVLIECRRCGSLVNVAGFFGTLHLCDPEPQPPPRPKRSWRPKMFVDYVANMDDEEFMRKCLKSPAFQRKVAKIGKVN